MGCVCVSSLSPQRHGKPYELVGLDAAKVHRVIAPIVRYYAGRVEVAYHGLPEVLCQPLLSQPGWKKKKKKNVTFSKIAQREAKLCSLILRSIIFVRFFFLFC